ncbi:ATP-dependent Clp protease adapter protein ClpS [Pseudobythopirellula maris]|uniref:ATP-dependent Clp protease adapter protein ClpS n=1 Tax=Pseudobythopirellula maris TaxID=2527991 RepID=A0A5C5ZUD7_9BACT|nr:ATP-dependent Clp protease adaptor ClpS [Pseudobythopirellula maris]TWT90521.1 ATP-dependent Clp protease adapter protein ClpS [Pseudobythopirellula maris]
MPGTKEAEAPVAPPDDPMAPPDGWDAPALDESASDSTPAAATVVRPKQKKKTKKQPPYAVVLHNDSLNSMPFVVGALRKVFGYTAQRATWLMMRVHFGGKARVWTGTRELAELKAEQLEACGADPLTASRGAQPLSVSVEPTTPT